MRVSVVVRSKDEAARLRLTLTSLAAQTAPAEVIVVDDGSSDHTTRVLDEAAGALDLRVITHPTPHGRSAASNAGARIASGDLLLFLDGDTLAAPDLVAAHAAAHAAVPNRIARGETYHLRGARFFADPEAGTPWPGAEARLMGIEGAALERARVTRDEILNRFEEIDARAEPGIYPGSAARRLAMLEMDALRNHPECSVLWAAACGSNLSVPTAAFAGVAGFNEELDLNEHRELAYKLVRAGSQMIAVDARTYHLTHRTLQRDPLADTRWEATFYDAHPVAAVKLLRVFWACLSERNTVPAEARIASLPELEAAAAAATEGRITA